MSARREASLVFIFVTLLLNVMGIGLIVPLLPELVSRFFGNNVSAGAHWYGILVVSYSLMQFVCSPLLGSLSDRFGRRPVLLLSTLGSGIDYLIMAVAPSYVFLLVARLISGMTGASITVGMAYIADITPEEKRAQSFGLVGAAFGLGFILGPALSGVLGHFNVKWPFFAAASLTLINFLYGWLVLPESLKTEHRQTFSWRRANPAGAFKMLRRTPVILQLALIVLLANMAQAGLESTWVLFTKSRFGWTPLQNGLSLAAVGLCTAAVQGGLLRTLMPRWGEKRVVLTGLATGIVTFSLFALAPVAWAMYPIIVINSLVGMAGPACQGLLSRQVGPQEQGSLQGAIASLTTLTRVIGPLTSTSLFSYFTSPAAPIHLDGVAFWLGALLMSGSLLLTLNLFARHPLNNEPVQTV